MANEITVRGPRSWVNDILLGDGINKSGTITMSLAPTKGDCYLKGGTVDVGAWTCTGGFILGIDDSDSDLAKFFVGNTASSFMNWDGAAMTYQIGSGDTLTVKGGGDINLESGGDIVFTPSDANPSLIKWSTVHNLGAGAAVARGLCLWPTVADQDYFYIGYEPVTPGYSRYKGININSYLSINLRCTRDDDNRAWIDLNAGGSVATNAISFYVEAVGADKRMVLTTTAFYPISGSGHFDLGTNALRWKDGYFTGTVTAQKFTDEGGGYDFFMPNPANPKKEMLRHWAIETDGLRTLYVGRGKTNGKGKTIIEMPEWFEALNDINTCEYYLTSLNGLCGLAVNKKMDRKGMFEVVSNIPNQEFSWQVIVVRGDKKGRKTIEDYPIIELIK